MARQSLVILRERLTTAQQQVVALPREGGASLFLRGLPGSGKTTALMARLAALLAARRRPHEILVLLPQRAQVEQWQRMVAGLDVSTPGGVDHVTFYSLSRRDLALFWPLVAREAGFARPDREPTFLTLETTQYYMWRIVEPLLVREGYFGDVPIRRGRLLSQLVDNLNKAAIVGFSHTDVYARLRAAWTGAPDRIHSYWQAQDCAIRFRAYCLAHNLLDFSLTTEVFQRYLFPHEVYRRYFRARYKHLLVDNVEENVPVAHDLMRWALGQCESALVAYDEGGGYRVFLGADERGGLELATQCGATLHLTELLEPTVHALAFSDGVRRALRVQGAAAAPTGEPARAVLGLSGEDGAGLCRYWISMIRSVAERVAELVARGTLPGEIAIVAPYVSDVMRFAVEEELSTHGIPLRLLRPATQLGDDPVVRAVLTLVTLAHPHWRVTLGDEALTVRVEDVAHALQVVLAGLDPIRARHLAQAVYAAEERELLETSHELAEGPRRGALARVWEAVGYQVKPSYEGLYAWLAAYREGESEPVDLFVARLFAEVLSLPGYGMYRDVDKGRACGRLVESAYKFRQAVQEDSDLAESEVARQYVELVLGGLASAEYLTDWPQASEGAVILSTIYAYLTRDLRSSYQFWLDLGSDGWWNRPNQPLTHPYVLSKRWPMGQPWRDVEEDQAKRDTLGRLIQGLAARCRQGIFLAYSELGIDGEEPRGPLLRAVSTALAKVARHD